jgi:hypothetical protein
MTRGMTALTRRGRTLAGLIMLLTLAGCPVGPTYEPPKPQPGKT